MAARNEYPEISTLRAFSITAREGSAARAAKILGVSQPAISIAIQKLEGMIGLPLFDRSSRPMQLTAAGRLLKNRADPILGQLESIASEVKSAVKSGGLDLRVGFSDSYSGCVSPYMLPRLVSRVKNLYAYSHSTPQIVRMLLEDKVDIAVATKFPRENPDISGLVLLTEKFLVVTPKKYEGKIHSVCDLQKLQAQLPVIRFNDASLDRIQIERVLRQCSIQSERVIAADINGSVLELVNSGTGWTIMSPLSLWMAHDHMANIACHEIEGLKATRSFYVLYRSPVYRSLANFIHEESLSILKEIVLPAIARVSPFLSESVTCAKD
ncbi:LysR family transcriptional regulator [Mesosutterella sp. AGMB02718]|uniref:LysR family transcriptional regulator n=1 Tax=Mesosutterella faecium TaxID=2925194 RepID=A0ABT7IQ82_9BURK|nr:LysR family transcriptional regulator [Mesosutterella sp. AGMB02718]MDL2060529.1 LysR family transcriptional regulator [Mesosutterella sp. AGMB02718]